MIVECLSSQEQAIVFVGMVCWGVDSLQLLHSLLLIAALI